MAPKIIIDKLSGFWWKIGDQACATIVIRVISRVLILYINLYI